MSDFDELGFNFDFFKKRESLQVQSRVLNEKDLITMILSRDFSK